MGRAYVRFALDHPSLLKVMFSPEFAEFEAPPDRLLASSERAYSMLVEGVRSALGPSSDEQRVAVAAFIAWSTVHGAVTLWLDGPLRHRLPKRGARAHFLALADAAIDASTRAIAAM